MTIDLTHEATIFVLAAFACAIMSAYYLGHVTALHRAHEHLRALALHIADGMRPFTHLADGVSKLVIDLDRVAATPLPIVPWRRMLGMEAR